METGKEVAWSLDSAKGGIHVYKELRRASDACSGDYVEMTKGGRGTKGDLGMKEALGNKFPQIIGTRVSRPFMVDGEIDVFDGTVRTEGTFHAGACLFSEDSG